MPGRQNITPRTALNKRVRANKVIRQRKTRQANLRFLPSDLDSKLIDRVLRWYNNAAPMMDIIQRASKLPIADHMPGLSLAAVDVYAILCYAESRGYYGLQETELDPATHLPLPTKIKQRHPVDDKELRLTDFRKIVAAWKLGARPGELVQIFAPLGPSGERLAKHDRIREHVNFIFICLNRRVRNVTALEETLTEQQELIAEANLQGQLNAAAAAGEDQPERPEEDEFFTLEEMTQAVAALLANKQTAAVGTTNPAPQTGYKIHQPAPTPQSPMTVDDELHEEEQITAALSQAATKLEEDIAVKDLQAVVAEVKQAAAPTVDIGNGGEGPQTTTDEQMKRTVSNMFRKKKPN